ncbi:tRNA glutamyl-Q(34) synthetase GluQRS [Sandarakinorhabdus sp.]|uniref:tRNA glutamyl-Q(34) synthetase GluQRS n=1 Tax=Sandarakinorhabdus sp. TaxID=1916663 RepID=UPI00286DD0FB|nr:tRNA glutamyl-Q(34) synthetase GluQRS [Sandarakinorhabdus sp.]
MIITRFAPSPTGGLHLGHVYSARAAWTLARAPQPFEQRAPEQGARAASGRFVLRLEDIDTERCRPEFADAILADLAWLGLDWDGPVWRQSDRGPVYAAALAHLRDAGLAYPCFCTRADIAAAASAQHGPDGAIYPGTCRSLSDAERMARSQSMSPAWRLDVAAAAARAGPLLWHDDDAGTVAADPCAGGDIVIARRGIGAAYALAVVVDDAAQGVTDVVRGTDLFAATHVQRLLQALLGLPAPRYHHHRLVLASDGRRLAKRDTAQTIAAMRAAGATPHEIFIMLDMAPLA